MKHETRSQKQNKAYWLFQEYIAQEMKNQGVTLDKLVLEVQPVPTRENVHIIFKSILEKMYNKNSTTKMSREEMKDCLDVYQDALARIGVHIYFPDADKKLYLIIIIPMPKVKTKLYEERIKEFELLKKQNNDTEYLNGITIGKYKNLLDKYHKVYRYLWKLNKKNPELYPYIVQ